MNGLELTQALLRTQGIPTGLGPAFLHADAAIATNQAFQEIWMAPLARDWKRRDTNLVGTSGTSGYVLADGVAEVTGPVWFDGYAVQPARDKGAFGDYANHYRTALGGSAAVPSWYLVDTLYGGDADPDAKSITIHFAPTPIWTTPVDDIVITKGITYRAIWEPPNFTDCSINDAGTVLPIPDRYVESILLPMCRYNLSRTAWFEGERLRASLREGYEQARGLLGLVDPSPLAA